MSAIKLKSVIQPFINLNLSKWMAEFGRHYEPNEKRWNVGAKFNFLESFPSVSQPPSTFIADIFFFCETSHVSFRLKFIGARKCRRVSTTLWLLSGCQRRLICHSAVIGPLFLHQPALQLLPIHCFYIQLSLIVINLSNESNYVSSGRYVKVTDLSTLLRTVPGAFNWAYSSGKKLFFNLWIFH